MYYLDSESLRRSIIDSLHFHHWDSMKKAAEELLKRQNQENRTITLYLSAFGLKKHADWFKENHLGGGRLYGALARKEPNTRHNVAVHFQASEIRLEPSSYDENFLIMYYTGTEPTVSVWTNTIHAAEGELGNEFWGRVGETEISKYWWMTAEFHVPISRVEVGESDGHRSLTVKAGKPLLRVDKKRKEMHDDLYACKLAIQDACYERDWDRVLHLADQAQELDEQEQEEAEERRKEEDRRREEEERVRFEELGRKVDEIRKAGAKVKVTVYTNPSGVSLHSEGDCFYAGIEPGMGYRDFTYPVQVDPEQWYREANGLIRVSAKK